MLGIDKLNALTGSIPPLGGIPGLTSFNAGLNQLSGSLPSDWLSLVNVREFDVIGNRCVRDSQAHRHSDRQAVR